MNFEESVWLLGEIQKNGIGFTPQKMRKFEVSQIDSTSIGIKMLEPADTVIEGQTIVPIVGVKVLMRTDRYPENPFDGDVVLNNTELGKYAEEPFLIPDLTQGTTYYFTAYPYSVNKVYDLTNSEEDRDKLQLAFDERVVITSVVDEPTLFPYANIVVYDVTDGTEQTKHVDGNGNVEFIVPIYHEYYVSSDPVDDFSYPADTEHFNAVGNGVNNLTFEYMYAKNVIDVNVSADSDTGFFSTMEVDVIAHNVTDNTEYTLTRIGGGNYRFPAENGKEYYISYGVVPGYGSPDDSEHFTIVKDVVKSITAQYVYDVETINVTVEAGDGSDVTGAIITLYNVTDGAEENKTWEGGTLTFFVRSGKSYYLNGNLINERYFTSKTEERVAAVGVIFNVTMNYKRAGTLEECTWDEIKMISDSGNAEKIFSIGDEKILNVTIRNGNILGNYTEYKRTGNLAITVKILDFDYGGIVFGAKKSWTNQNGHAAAGFILPSVWSIGMRGFGGGFPLSNGYTYDYANSFAYGALFFIRNFEAGRPMGQGATPSKDTAEFLIFPPNQTNDDVMSNDKNHIAYHLDILFDDRRDFYKLIKSVKRKYYYLLKNSYNDERWKKYGLELGPHVCEVESKIWPLTAEDLGYSVPPWEFSDEPIPVKRFRGFTDDDSLLANAGYIDDQETTGPNIGYPLANPGGIGRYPISSSSTPTNYAINTIASVVPCANRISSSKGTCYETLSKSIQTGEKGYTIERPYYDYYPNNGNDDRMGYYWCFVI